MTYKIFINTLLKLNVRLFYNPRKFEYIFIVDNNEDEISKYFSRISYSSFKITITDDLTNLDSMEEISFWDRYMVFDFPNEETALYFTMKYPTIIESSDDV